MFDVMPLRNWRLLALVLAFICAVSHLCVAGPIIPCIEGEQPVPLPGPLSSLFLDRSHFHNCRQPFFSRMESI